MTEQEYKEYNEMMAELYNDPDYIALQTEREQEMMEYLDSLSDAEIYGEVK